jgi:hypothetical protein
MKKLSYRDVWSATTDTHHDQSETENNNPKHHQELELMKPQVDTRIQIDPERAEVEMNLAMPLNARNQLTRGK